MAVTTIPHGGTGGAHAHRVIFIDLGRFLALVFMDPARYSSELEKLVTDIALKTREIRAADGK